MIEAINTFIERFPWVPMAAGGAFGLWFFWWLVTEPYRWHKNMLKEVEEESRSPSRN